MLSEPFSAWGPFSQKEAVAKVLLSNLVNCWNGQEGREFEGETASWWQVSHAITVANGTPALDLEMA